MRTPAETQALKAAAIECGYVSPPDDLIPTRGPYDGEEPWNRVYKWFEEHTKNASTAVLVLFALRAHCSLGVAYEQTDRWFKHRNMVDDDGNYCSYN